jgi:hypothetical protein
MEMKMIKFQNVAKGFFARGVGAGLLLGFTVFAASPGMAQPPNLQFWSQQNVIGSLSHCKRAILLGDVGWGHGNSDWSDANLNRLCGNSPNMSDQPVRCYERVMSGNVNWGGGTLWVPGNALDLCERTSSADNTIGCFERGIASGLPWQRAIQSCGI